MKLLRHQVQSCARGRVALVLRGMVLGLALLAMGSDALAQGRPITPPGAPTPLVDGPRTPVQRVQVELMVVHATNAHTNVDAQLEPLLPHLKFLNYTGFTVVGDNKRSLGLKQDADFTVVGGRKVNVELLDRTEREAKIRVRMFNDAGEKLLDTTVSIHRNKSFIVAGPRHDGGVLILPVTARY